MGVGDNIRWLKNVDDRVELFVYIAKRGPIKVRRLKSFLGSEDWWPTKYMVQDLEERGLIEEEMEEGYELSDDGEKVFESLKTVYDIESV